MRFLSHGKKTYKDISVFIKPSESKDFTFVDTKGVIADSMLNKSVAGLCIPTVDVPSS
jgi:hypothetical protein